MALGKDFGLGERLIKWLEQRKVAARLLQLTRLSTVLIFTLLSVRRAEKTVILADLPLIASLLASLVLRADASLSAVRLRKALSK